MADRVLLQSGWDNIEGTCICIPLLAFSSHGVSPSLYHPLIRLRNAIILRLPRVKLCCLVILYPSSTFDF
jgi:hypothetical protein